MDLTTIAALVLAAVAGIASNATAELLLAPYLRRKMVAQVKLDVQAETVALRDAVKLDVQALLEAQKPGQMRGGHDPVALAEAKAAKAEDRAVAEARARVGAQALIAERLGPLGLEFVRNTLGEETLAKVYATGDRWKESLAPVLAKLPQRNGTDAARTESPFMLMHQE